MKVSIDYKSNMFHRYPGVHFSEERDRILDMMGLLETILFVSPNNHLLLQHLKKVGKIDL